MMSKPVADPMVVQMHGEIHNLIDLVALILTAMAGQTQPPVGLLSALVMTEQTHSLMTQHSGAMMTEMVLEAINPEIMLTIVLVIQEHQLKID